MAADLDSVNHGCECFLRSGVECLLNFRNYMFSSCSQETYYTGCLSLYILKTIFYEIFLDFVEVLSF